MTNSKAIISPKGFTCKRRRGPVYLCYPVPMSQRKRHKVWFGAEEGRSCSAATAGLGFGKLTLEEQQNEKKEFKIT